MTKNQRFLFLEFTFIMTLLILGCLYYLNQPLILAVIPLGLMLFTVFIDFVRQKLD